MGPGEGVELGCAVPVRLDVVVATGVCVSPVVGWVCVAVHVPEGAGVSLEGASVSVGVTVTCPPALINNVQFSWPCGISFPL